jgi:hypothetical protein
MKQPAQDLIAGFTLVMALHLGFGLLNILLMSIANSSGLHYIYKIGVAVFPWPGLTQFFYLVPIVLHYRRLGKFEMVKGISIGAVLTLFLTSACFHITVDGMRFNFSYSMAITIVLAIATYRWFNHRRSR